MNKTEALKELEQAYRHLENVYDCLGGDIDRELSESLDTGLDMLDDIRMAIVHYEPPKEEHDPFGMADKYYDEKMLEEHE